MQTSGAELRGGEVVLRWVHNAMAALPETRLITKVATLYHEQRLTQTDIAKRLGISQVTVSRLLKRAEDKQIVRTTVISPPGAFVDLEGALERKFGLMQAIVAESHSESDEAIQAAIGAAAAYFLMTTLTSQEVIGVSSWSASLLAMVDHMHPIRKIEDCRVVQVLGGLGNPSAEAHANHLVTRLARLVNGEPCFLPAPGVVGAASSAGVLLKDPHVRQTTSLFSRLTIALVGIGSIEPSFLVASSGNVFSAEELQKIRDRGAVGDICLRFYDSGGREVRDAIGNRVIGIDLETFKRVPRAVAIAGGIRKHAAILGALRGKLINILVTDQFTAGRLVKDSSPNKPEP
jgi:DNA-binding transcriptional regulator LsrR (DeoR family)